MASPFLRIAMAAASSSRRRAATLTVVAPHGATPSPLLPFAAAGRVGGLLLLPRRAGASAAPPAHVRAAAFSSDAGAARGKVQSLGKNGDKALAVKEQEGAAAAAASPCRFDDNLAADLKNFVRGELTQHAEHLSLIVYELLHVHRVYRDDMNRNESFRMMMFTALIAFAVDEVTRHKDHAKAGTGGNNVKEEVKHEKTGGNKAGTGAEGSTSGGKAGAGAEDSTGGAKAGGAEGSTGGAKAGTSAEDSTGSAKAGTGAKDSTGGGGEAALTGDAAKKSSAP